MATNKPVGDNKRIGAVRKRSQVLNPKTQKYTKRAKDSGQFMDNATTAKKFKGVRREKSAIDR